MFAVWRELACSRRGNASEIHSTEQTSLDDYRYDVGSFGPVASGDWENASGHRLFPFQNSLFHTVSFDLVKSYLYHSADTLINQNRKSSAAWDQVLE